MNKEIKNYIGSEEYEKELDKLFDTEIKKFFYEACKGEAAGFSGWTRDLYVGKNYMYLSGSMSQGSQSMDSFEGREICLLSIPCQINMDGFFIDYWNLEEGQKKIIIDSFINDGEGEDREEIEDNIGSIDIDTKFNELYPNEYNDYLENYISCYWDTMQDLYREKIDRNIEELD